MPKAKKLTDKQDLFCKEYIISLNATQAAIRAGYSEKTAKEIGAQNLSKLNIAARIQALRKNGLDKLELKHEDILKELHNWAFSDVTDLMELTTRQIKALPLEVRRLVTGFKALGPTVVTNEKGEDEITMVYEVKLVDKHKAIDMINKHLGFYEEDNKQTQAPAGVNLTPELIKSISKALEEKY